MPKKADQPRRERKNRQIVGFSFSPDLAAEVKMEAAGRNISLGKLFEEMWAHYKKNKNVPNAGTKDAR